MAEDGEDATGGGLRASPGYPDYADFPNYARKRVLMGQGRLLHALAVQRVFVAFFRAVFDYTARLFTDRFSPRSGRAGE